MYKQACVYMYIDSSAVFLKKIFKHIKAYKHINNLKKKTVFKDFLYKILNLRHKRHVLLEFSMVSWLVLPSLNCLLPAAFVRSPDIP